MIADRLRALIGTCRGAARWTEIALRKPAEGAAAVSYGHDRLPDPSAPGEGGMVKFQRLQSAFPNRPRDFNLLYLGSSSLPADATTLVRLARRRSAPVVLNQNGVAYPAWASDRTESINAPLRAILGASDHVVYQSAFCKVAADRYLGEPAGAWEVLHNPVDTTVFTPADRDVARGPVILVAGDQYHPHRFTIALQTFALVASARPDARFVVTGRLPDDGPRVAAELGLDGRVSFVGRYALRDAPDVYRRADILLHPRVNDPCPNVVVEAMAAGLPVVYSASGGTPELVGEEAGVGIEADPDWERDTPPSAEELAAGVETVLSRLAAFKEAARARAVERFDFTRWVERHSQLFDELLA